MNIGVRISQIRKSLNLNQDEFGQKINVTRSAISNYEKGTRNIMDRVITDICREFNVNEEWLRTGIEPMFMPTTNDKLMQLSKEYNLSELEETFFNSYLNLDSKKREAVCEFFEDVLNKSLSMLSSDLAATKEETFEEKKKRELEAYAQELDAEQKGRILSASEKPKGA